MFGVRDRAGLLLWLSGLLVLASTAAGARQRPGIDELLARVEQRIVEFYRRAEAVICIEKSIVQPIGLNYSPEGMARTVESELRILGQSEDGNVDPTVVRRHRKVNGRMPRERDRKDRSGCTDPEPLAIEVLTFLLPAHRAEYKFTSAGPTSDRGRDAWMIDFETANGRSKAELIEDKGGHEDCFDWSGHVATRGRIWVDARTYDVIRVDRHNRGPVDVRVPVRIQRRHHLDGWVMIERDDVTTRYETVVFDDPEESFLVPESVDSVTLVRGGLQSTRRSHTFSDYRRFVTAGRVIK